MVVQVIMFARCVIRFDSNFLGGNTSPFISFDKIDLRLHCVNVHVLTFLKIILQDCGYVFTKGPAAWAALPDNYSCPPCGSAKRRFTKVPKGSANSNKAASKVTNAKKEEPTKKKSWF